MKTSIVLTIIGILSVFFLNQRFFSYSLLELVWMISCANGVMVTSLFLSLRLERIAVVKKLLLGSIGKMWLFFCFVFGLQMIICCPILSHFFAFSGLFFPLLFSGFIGVIAFGFLRDYLVRKAARGISEISVNAVTDGFS
jgi:hypothetical protein